MVSGWLWASLLNFEPGAAQLLPLRTSDTVLAEKASHTHSGVAWSIANENGTLVNRSVPVPLVPASAGIVQTHDICPDDSAQYSGFFPAGEGAEYFFWLGTSRSGKHDDPLVVWFTGGPGCASMSAMLTENGPCSVASASHNGDWQTTRNPWSWTEAASVMWIDQPNGVGFSTGPKAVGTEEAVGGNLVTFLGHFYERFPHLTSAPLYIVGESYGGHYVPSVAKAVLDQGARLPPDVRLAGMAIGNGWVHPIHQTSSKPLMAFTGGVGGSLKSGVIDQSEFLDMEESLAECIDNLRACDERGEHCTAPNCWTPMLTPIGAKNLNPYDLRKQCVSPPLCYDTKDEELFLRLPEVQLKLGVPEPRAWADCNDTVHEFFENSGDFNSRTNDTIAYLLKSNVPVLVYHGDTDFMCDWIGGKRWVSALAWKHHDAWNRAMDVPFVVNGHTAGQERSVGGFTFIQLYQSGHMVPMDQPENSLAMLREFLSRESRWKQASADPLELNTMPSGFSPYLGLALCAALAAAAVSRMRSSKEYSSRYSLLEA